MTVKTFGRVLAIFVLLAFAMSFSACCCVLPFQAEKNPEIKVTIPETAVPMPEPTFTEPEPEIFIPVPETTQNTQDGLDTFLAQAKGIWIFDGTIMHMYDDQYNFEALIISDTILNTGVYPGGTDRPGVFEKVEDLGNNAYIVHLLFEEGYFYDEYLQESRNSFQIAFPANGKLTMLFDDGTQYYLTYGGIDFEEANRTAGRICNG